MTLFARYIGIDYSGARTPTSSQKGLRVYAAAGAEAPQEVLPPPGPRKYWTRRGLAEWLVSTLRAAAPALVGIDHAFSFPEAYFARHGLLRDWPAFLNDFCAHWPTDGDAVRVDFVRRGQCGHGAARTGDARWRRVTDRAAGSAKSPFHFDVQGSVAKSTHAGLPWLRYLRAQLGPSVRFWPFDGWDPPPGVHVIAEIYPSLWRGDFPAPELTPDQEDACAACGWLQRADRAGILPHYLAPPLPPDVQTAARYEGWILGVDTAAGPPRRN